MSKQKERMVLELVNHVNYDNIAAAGTTDVCSAQNLVEDTAITIDGVQPDVPRSLVLTVVDTTASITTGYIECVGINQNGELIEEDVDVSAGAGTYNTDNAFAIVNSVTPRDMATLGGAGDETLAVGFGLKIGVPTMPGGKIEEFFKACVDGANEAVGTVNKTYGTIITTTAPAGGTHDYDFWYSFKASLL
jgi:hypothetical protein